MQYFQTHFLTSILKVCGKFEKFLMFHHFWKSGIFCCVENSATSGLLALDSAQQVTCRTVSRATSLTCRTDVAFLHNCKLTCCTVFLLAAHLFFLLFYFAFQFDRPSMLFRWWWRWRTTTQSISKNDLTSWVQKTTRYDSTKLADLQFSKSEQLSKKNESFHKYSWHLSNWEVLSKWYFFTKHAKRSICLR